MAHATGAPAHAGPSVLRHTACAVDVACSHAVPGSGTHRPLNTLGVTVVVACEGDAHSEEAYRRSEHDDAAVGSAVAVAARCFPVEPTLSAHLQMARK